MVAMVVRVTYICRAAQVAPMFSDSPSNGRRLLSHRCELERHINTRFSIGICLSLYPRLRCLVTKNRIEARTVVEACKRGFGG